MAQLNSRGTLTRTRWDYFEHSNGVGFVWGSVASGQIGTYFANNSSGSTAVDIYTINWSSSASATFSFQVLLPPLIFTPLTPTESNLFALQPDQAAPPGVLGMFTAQSGAFHSLLYYPAFSQGTQLAPIMGSYLMTLPPGWGIGITGTPSSGGCSLAMTIWFQYVTDNIIPAR